MVADPELTDDDVLGMLCRARKNMPRGGRINIDGHALRNPNIRVAARIAVERGWLDLGNLIEGDQWSWYEAKITEAGLAAIFEYEMRT